MQFTVRVAQGEGLIARFGDVVVYTTGNDDQAAVLLTAAASAAQSPRPGAVLADQLGPVAFGDARGVSFGAVVPSPEGTHVLLRGQMVVRAETAGGAYRLSGESDPRWVRHLLPGAAHTVELSDRPSGVTAIPRTDLVAGVVGGGGFVLVGAGAAHAARPEPEATERISSPPEDPATSKLAPRAAPRQTVTASTAAGVLSTPDGAVYLLDRSYVIGRAPLSDEAVRTATSSPIVVDHDPYVSRVHAYVITDRNGVFVRDAGTSAGTFIAAPGASDWTQIGTVPTRLESGWSMRIGGWVATYRAVP